MYFSVSNGRVLSPGNYRDGDGGPPPLSSTEPSKMPPRTFNRRALLPGRYTEAGRRGAGRQRCEAAASRKSLLHSLALQRGELPPPPNLPAEATFVSFGKWRRNKRRKRKKKKRTCWEQGEEVTKEGIKGGLGSAFKFRGPHWSAERDPLRGRPRAPLVRARSQAAAASALGPVGEFS